VVGRGGFEPPIFAL